MRKRTKLSATTITTDIMRSGVTSNSASSKSTSKRNRRLNQGRLTWAGLFKTPAFRKRLFVGPFIPFVLTNALCALVYAFAYPETKGKSSEEIDEIFGDVKISHGNNAKLAVDEGNVETLEVRDEKTN
ncbi:hypothetical protein F5Y06DRAFT_118879 [Hypoxylon sp. FL0890]|nr:hypothetical protein F5Y06DRAFT_118879 [Hypoxylon sp. FL0890]